MNKRMHIVKEISFVFICTFIIFTAFFLAKPAEEAPVEVIKTEPFLCERVVDGDTIIVNIDGSEEKVRLIGIDTPESVHADESKNTSSGAVASEITKDLLEGKKVALEYDTEKYDKYDRLLAYVYVDDIMVNAYLVENGYARVMEIEPNTKYAQLFSYNEDVARQEGRGFWENGEFTE